jgi:hypothetical protein
MDERLLLRELEREANRPSPYFESPLPRDPEVEEAIQFAQRQRFLRIKEEMKRRNGNDTE